MVVTMCGQLRQARAHVTTRLVATALLLLTTPIALAVPAMADPAATTRGEFPGSVAEHHRIGYEPFSLPFSAPDASGALAQGAATTAGPAARRPGAALPAGSRLAPTDVAVTLAAGSRLFGSHVPVLPMDGSSQGGSAGPVGVLTPPSTDISAAAGTRQPPPPPYGRRTTWTFRTPLTRPG